MNSPLISQFFLAPAGRHVCLTKSKHDKSKYLNFLVTLIKRATTTVGAGFPRLRFAFCSFFLYEPIFLAPAGRHVYSTSSHQFPQAPAGRHVCL